MSIKQVLYRATSKATGGREGRAVSSDGVLDVKLTTPKELGGAGAVGTNPEQLFAAGYSACFLGAMKFVGGRDKITVPADVSVEGTVGIGAIETGSHTFCQFAFPSSNARTRRVTSLAKRASCVTTICVIFSLLSSRITLKTSSTRRGSSCEVGSSYSMIFGCIARLRAMATRCCCPPDNVAGYFPVMP